MVRSILLVLLVTSPAFADDKRSDPFLSCPAKDGKLDDKVAWVKQAGCGEEAIFAIHACSEGASTEIALTNTATESCRAKFAKDADLTKEHDAIGKRCEAKLGNRTKKKLDNELDAATCRLHAAITLRMLAY